MARIVVGTDGTESGDEAVRFAAAEAAAAGAVLEIVTVWPEPDTVTLGKIGAPQYVNRDPGEGTAEHCSRTPRRSRPPSPPTSRSTPCRWPATRWKCCATPRPTPTCS